MRLHHGGNEVVFAWAAEDATYPEVGASVYGTAPASFAYGTFYDTPTINRIGGIEPGYAAGADTSLFDVYQQRYAEISGPVRVGSKAFIAKMLKGSGGYRDLADLALYLGVSDANSDGYGELYRFCKCASAQFSFQQDREIMVTPTFRSLGWPDEIAALDVLSPAYVDLAGTANPLGWVNVQTIAIAGTAYRDVVTGINFTVNNNLAADNTRPDLGENVPISRAAMLLKPGQISIEGTINFNSRMDAAQVNAAATSMLWGNIVITTNDTALGGSQSFVVTLTGTRPRSFTQQGGDSRQQVTHSVPFTAKGMSVV